MVDAWPARVAIYATLSAAPATYPVFDSDPRKSGATVSYPYILFGQPTGTPDEEIDQDGTNSTLTIHGFSDYPGDKEAYAILQFIRARIDHAAALGGGIWACFEEFWAIQDESEPDKSRQHVITRYRIRLN